MAGQHQFKSKASRPSSDGGTFEVYEDASGQARFRYRASAGEVVFSSEGYVSKASALKAIESIKRHAGKADTLLKPSSLVEHILSGPEWPQEMYEEVNRREETRDRAPIDF